MTGMIGGFKDKKIESRSKVEPVTTQYIGKYRQGLDVIGQVYYSLVTNSAVQAGCTTSVLQVVSTSSYKVGDLLKFTSGNLDTEFAFIQALTSTTITLSQTLSEAPAALAAYNIYRAGIPLINSDGAVEIYTNPAVPITMDLRKIAGQTITNFVSVDGFATGETVLNLGVYSAGIPGWVPWDGSVTVSSSALPSGAATAALQTTGNTSLGSIDSATTNLGSCYRSDGNTSAIALSWCGSDYGGQYYEPFVDSAGYQYVAAQVLSMPVVTTNEARQSAAAITVTAASASSVQVAASNSAAKKRIFYNDSTAVAYLKYGTTASTSDFTIKLFPDATWEELHYYGRCDAIWTSATGNMRVTVVTA